MIGGDGAGAGGKREMGWKGGRGVDRVVSGKWGEGGREGRDGVDRWIG